MLIMKIGPLLDALPDASQAPDAGACLAYRAKYRGVGRLL